jgi:transglutaminase superfamily protein
LFLTRLRNYSRLPAAEKTLAARAILCLAVTRVALRLLSFDRARALMAGRAAVGPRSNNAWPLAVRRAVLRASRSLPGSSCLAQSLVAERLLRRGGSHARLTIGVAPASAADAERVTLDAHAWVESGGVLVTGDDPHERYRILATFGAE